MVLADSEESGTMKRMCLPLPFGATASMTLQGAYLVDGMSEGVSSAPTVVVGQGDRPQGQVQPASGSQDVEGMPHELDVEAFQHQYQQHLRGEITSTYVQAMWGEATLDLMQAQQIGGSQGDVDSSGQHETTQRTQMELQGCRAENEDDQGDD